MTARQRKGTKLSKASTDRMDRYWEKLGRQAATLTAVHRARDRMVDADHVWAKSPSDESTAARDAARSVYLLALLASYEALGE